MSIYNPRSPLSGLVIPAARYIRDFWRKPALRDLNRLYLYAKSRGKTNQGGEFQFQGRRVQYADFPSFVSAFDEIFVNQIYDLGEIKDERPYFLDCGANVGLASIYWSIRYPMCEGIAFEPDPNIYQILKKNLDTNGCSIKAENYALDSVEGEIGFVPDGADGGQIECVNAGSKREAIKVESKKLSQFLDRRVHLLKIDIEGAELSVLEECSSKLENVEAIFVEAHSFPDKPQDFGRIFQLLQDHGFRCSTEAVRSAYRGFKAVHTKWSMDLNLNIYAFRKRIN